MKKISIIVPIYNVQDYLEKCLLSIVTQEASTEYYELIAVNDGATDNSRQILQKLSEKYPFIKIVDKENGGLSSARNAGLKHATGEYIFFFDADDWIAKDSLSFLLKWIEEKKADVYLFGIKTVDENGNENLLTHTMPPNNQIMDVEDYLINYTLRSSAWQGLFAKKIFDEISLTFKDGFISEDDDFVVRYLSKANTIVCNNHIVYYYFQRSNSISKSKELEIKLINDKIIMMQELDNYIQKFSGKRKKGLERKMDFLAVDIIRLLMRKKHTPKTIDQVLHELKGIGYFPLRKNNYSSKYNLFRILFSSTFAIKSAQIFSKHI